MPPQSPFHAFENWRRAVFGNSDPIDFARSQILQNRESFFRELPQHPFTDKEKLQIAEEQHGSVEKYARYFQMKSPSYKIALAACLARTSFNVGPVLRDIGLSEPDDLLAVAGQLEDYPLARFISTVQFDKEEHRAKAAFRLAQAASFDALLNEGLKKIELSPERWRNAVLIAARHLPPNLMVDMSDHCGLSAIEDQRKFMLLLASSSPACCIASRRLMAGFDETTRKELAEAVAKSDPSSLLHHIDRFGISDHNARLQLFLTYFKPAIRQIGEEYKVLCEKESIQCDRCDFMWHVADACHKIVTVVFGKDTSSPIFSEYSGKLGIDYSWIATLLDTARKQPDPLLAELLGRWAHYVNLFFSDNHVQIPDAVGNSFISTLGAIFEYRKPDARIPLTNMLTRPFLLDTDENAATLFDSVNQQLPRAHSLVFRPVLFDLSCKKVLDKALPGRLSRALSHTATKDSARSDRIMNGLLALTKAELAPAEKRRLLNLLVPDAPTKNEIRSFAAAMQALSEYLPLLEKPALAKSARSKLASVQRASDLQRVLGEIIFVVLDRQSLVDAGKSCGPGKFLDRLRNYNGSLAEPSPIVGYATRLFCHLDGSDEKDAILSVINRFVDVTILSDDPQDFVRAKNDLSVSEHLRRAAAIDPEATQRWLTKEDEVTGVFSDTPSLSPEDVDVMGYLRERIVRDAHVAPGTYPTVERVLNGAIKLADAQHLAHASSLRKNEADLLQLLDAAIAPAKKVKILSKLLFELEIEDYGQQEEFERNLADLKDLLTPNEQPNRDFSQWRVQFKHDAETYLRCGTIVGSCQNVYGTPGANMALMGYVMQGKNRMIAVTSPDGALQARCIIRLGVDEKSNQLVMHLERMYANAGVPNNCKQVLRDFAKKLAREIGVPLVSHSVDSRIGAEYPNEICFYPDSAVYEYVDSLSLGKVDSREGYRLGGARWIST